MKAVLEIYATRVQNLRREYWTTIGEVKLSDLVFIDETGVNIAMTRHFARATKGKRAYGKCPNNRGKNITLIGAIATSGILAPFTFEGWTFSRSFPDLCNRSATARTLARILCRHG